MRFANIVDRVQSEFIEMPGLELTVPQAVRLWSLGADDCRSVIDALVDAGFLRWTVRRTIVRTGREASAVMDRQLAHVSVGSVARRDKSVLSVPGE
jgi:hypothetical protein